jgi:hypothetical protein
MDDVCGWKIVIHQLWHTCKKLCGILKMYLGNVSLKTLELLIWVLTFAFHYFIIICSISFLLYSVYLTQELLDKFTTAVVRFVLNQFILFFEMINLLKMQ